MNLFNSLPAELQLQVRSVLSAYDSVIIDYENGRYRVGSLSLRDKYPSDFRHVGIIKNTDIFSLEEIKANYAAL